MGGVSGITLWPNLQSLETNHHDTSDSCAFSQQNLQNQSSCQEKLKVEIKASNLFERMQPEWAGLKQGLGGCTSVSCGQSCAAVRERLRPPCRGHIQTQI